MEARGLADGVAFPKLDQPGRAERFSHVAHMRKPSKERARPVLNEDSLIICVAPKVMVVSVERTVSRYVFSPTYRESRVAFSIDANDERSILIENACSRRVRNWDEVVPERVYNSP